MDLAVIIFALRLKEEVLIVKVVVIKIHHIVEDILIRNWVSIIKILNKKISSLIYHTDCILRNLT